MCSSIIAVVIGAVVVFVVEEQRRIALTRAEAHAANLSGASEELIKRTFDSVDGAIDVLARRIAVEGPAFDLASWTTLIPEWAASTMQISVVGPDGRMTASTLEKSPSPIDLADRDYFKVHRDNAAAGLFVGTPILGPVSRKATIPVSKRLATPGGAFAGVIVFSLDPEFLTALHNNIDLGQTGSIMFVGRDGVVRARFTSTETADASGAVGSSAVKLKAVQEASLVKAGAYTDSSCFDGVTRLFHWRRVANYPLVVVVGLGREEVLKPVNEQSAMIAGVGGGAIMLTITLAAMLTHEISRRSAYEVALLQKSEKLRIVNEQLLSEHRTLRATSIALANERCSLRQANAELEAAKLRAETATEAKSAFLANMSHELRTPLNAIIGFSEIIRDRLFGDLPPRYADYAANIHQSGVHLLAVIGNILDIAKIEARKMELCERVIELEALVSGSVQAIRPQAVSKKIAISTTFPNRPVSLLCDETRFKQIMLNLLSNAVKFTPDFGKIAVEADIDVEGDMTICIADTGIGMSPSEVESAFETFRQIDNSLSKRYEGTGLGLPLARELAVLHGGNLRMESAPSKGTKVFVILPASRVVRRRVLEPVAA